MGNFEIPIVLFMFKRVDKLILIIERISEIKPLKIYLIGDGGRTVLEQNEIEESRVIIEKSINWKCEIITHYSSNNIGVYENIANGARWVFKHEKMAIFLEDDNLPELSFFPFCSEMLNKYKDDSRVLWICGTNYLKEYEPEDGSSYVITKNMMPCGWASWASKFLKYYEGDLSLWQDRYIKKRIKSEYLYKPLMKQDISNWNDELMHKEKYNKFISWDYQMSFSQRVHGLYAIVPKYNQITNIGVDLDSIHHGYSYDNVMIRRFCGLPTKPLEFPLKHPKALLIDRQFEIKIAKIITLPWILRQRKYVGRSVKKILGIEIDKSLKEIFLKKFTIKNE